MHQVLTSSVQLRCESGTTRSHLISDSTMAGAARDSSTATPEQRQANDTGDCVSEPFIDQLSWSE